MIRKVAEEGPCVIVGRCADYVLKERTDVINVFIWATLPFRVERAVRIDKVNPVKAEDAVLRMDKRRANYYSYHANDKWGKVYNYHLSIQSDFGGIDKTVEVIKLFVEHESEWN